MHIYVEREKYHNGQAFIQIHRDIWKENFSEKYKKVFVMFCDELGERIEFGAFCSLIIWFVLL